MKKFFLLMLIALLVTIVLTSCGRSPSTAPASPAAAALPTALSNPALATEVQAPSTEVPATASSTTATEAVTTQASPIAFTLTSSAFSPEGEIPVRYSCNGEDISPSLAWGEPPSGTQSFAIIVDDPDAGGFTHWMLYNLPASSRSLPENVPKQAELPGGGLQGLSDFGKPGYGGPCPPRGTHHYHFQLYALDSALNLPAQSKKADVLIAMEGHILDQASLTGLYTHR